MLPVVAVGSPAIAKKHEKMQKHINALNAAMKIKSCAVFMHHLCKISQNLLEKRAISDFLQANKTILAKNFIIKRTGCEPNGRQDRLNPKEWGLGPIHCMSAAESCMVDGKKMFTLNGKNLEMMTIYELRRDPKKKNSLLLGFLRLDKVYQEKTYIVRYLATSQTVRGKCLAYLILNFVIKDVLAIDRTCQVILQDDSKGVATHLYENVGVVRRLPPYENEEANEFTTEKEVIERAHGYGVKHETWFTYTAKP